MIGALRHVLMAACAVAIPIAPAVAQSSISAGVETITDESRHGLSWSDGRATVSGNVLATLSGIEAGARVTALRGSGRHGGADAVFDLTLATGLEAGAIRLRADGTAHLFGSARGRMDYFELGGSAGYGYGPLYLTSGAMYAPSQHAIGGSNLYLYGDASVGIPGTSLTATAAIGHSSGAVDDPQRAQRLRPGGDYTDWRLGLEHRRDALTIGVDYVGTDITRHNVFGPFTDTRHAGDRLVGRLRLGF